MLVAAGSSIVGFAGLAIGVLLGVRTRRRVTAVAMVLVTWVVLAVLFDFAAIALLQFTGDGEPGPLLLLLAANRIDGKRALGLVGLGADVLLGPTGAALSRLLGPIRGSAARRRRSAGVVRRATRLRGPHVAAERLLKLALGVHQPRRDTAQWCEEPFFPFSVVPHCQSRISGMSSPYCRMYRL